MASFDHRSQRRMRELHERQHIQADLRALTIERRLVETACRAEPGVVDEQLDWSSTIGDARCHPGD